MSTLTTSGSHIDLAALVPLVNEFVQYSNEAEDLADLPASEVANELAADRAQAITETLPDDAEWEPTYVTPWDTVGIKVVHEGASIQITPVR